MAGLWLDEFEVGRVFLRAPQAARGPLSVAGVHQPMRVAAAAYGPALAGQWDGADRARRCPIDKPPRVRQSRRRRDVRVVEGA